jgi:hypothetical protein
MAAKKSKGTGRSERSEKVAETVAYKGRVGVEPGNVHRFEEIPVNVPEESVRRTLGRPGLSGRRFPAAEGEQVSD